MQDKSISFKTVSLQKDESVLNAIKHLLALVDLSLDNHVNDFVVGYVEQQIVACAGLDHNIIKCVAVHPDYQGSQLTLKLINTVIDLADEKNQHHLFLYTKPDNVPFFKSCGFYPLVKIDETVTLMENTPVGINHYCQKLAQHKKVGTCGAIVMNANPFTRGHLYLVELAAKTVDWLYIFVVEEDASLFPTAIRHQLVKQGVSHLGNVSVFLGSEYMVSKATFPSYFLKDQTLIEQTYMAIDLLLFREYIAPALTISVRFVGTEPRSELTNAYNQAMPYWLEQKALSTAPIIKVIEIPRVTASNDVISASRVRALLAQKRYQEVYDLVPKSTWSYLQQHYVIEDK
ncbi:[citrate (pro-3S)-lyase] ligase [Orbus hercynius]|uniref:[Citrate [pro-3S]-lyase] ligase n=1 Tax=Orbus hercynius TaxID=593135 RepID=A0A495RK62_9GAMM|nr:[citrate (pro-3S)-lyase] ligase [Orbus hercynius]RKS87721.1 [citrate (pro-3S)-lyase] ligase [Orbus hercynius]